MQSTLWEMLGWMKHKVESRLPESERKWSRSVLSDSLQPHGLPPGSSLHGILQARLLEWIAMPSSGESSCPMDRICVSCSSCIEADSLPLCHQGSTISGIHQGKSEIPGRGKIPHWVLWKWKKERITWQSFLFVWL